MSDKIRSDEHKARRKAALRDNLKRRKAAARKANAVEKPADGSGSKNG